MPIDTSAKRRQAAAVRLWWLRRVVVGPDGTISQADRQTLARSYGGILVAAAADVTYKGSMTHTATNKNTHTATAANANSHTATVTNKNSHTATVS